MCECVCVCVCESSGGVGGGGGGVSGERKGVEEGGVHVLGISP